MNGQHAVEKLELIERIADGLAMPDHARRALGLAPTSAGRVESSTTDDETASLELARRIAASDVNDETLGQLRRLLIVSGWLSLIAATVHIDLRQRAAADAELMTAFHLAQHADYPEIAAWSLETRAWDALTDGHFRLTADLSQQARAVAHKGGSAYIQATAQQGRAHARMGARQETPDCSALTGHGGGIATLSSLSSLVAGCGFRSYRLVRIGNSPLHLGASR